MPLGDTATYSNDERKMTDSDSDGWWAQFDSSDEESDGGEGKLHSGLDLLMHVGPADRESIRY